MRHRQARAQAPTSDDRAAIARLLDVRARAVLARDRDAFMSSVADLSPEFARRQQRLIAHMSDVPFGRYALEVSWGRYGELARPSDIERYPGAESVSIPVVEERYTIKGFDREAAVEDFFYTFVKLDGRWKIAEDTDLDDLTLYSSRHLWDFGPVNATMQGHFLVLQHRCASRSQAPCSRVSRDVVELAEDALARVWRYWSASWMRRVVVLVPRTGREVKRMLQATFDPQDFVAFAYSTVDVANGFDYTGHRIILNPGALSGRDRDSILRVLAHELLHIATRDYSGPFVPVFVDEGAAEHVGSDADPGSLAFFDAEVAAGIFDGLIPEDFQFTTGTTTEIFRSYQKAQSAVTYFIERWGMKTFTRFYRRLGRVTVRPGTIRYHLDRALRRETGLSFEDFQQAWADSITS